MLRTLVVVWICFAVFGNHDNGSGDSGGGTSIEMGSGSNGQGLPVDGHDQSALLPVETGVDAIPVGAQQFRVEVASESAPVTVTLSTRLGPVEKVVANSYVGFVAPDTGYPAAAGPAGQQSSKGPVGPTVSGIVTATAAKRTSTVQCRVYADEVLVLMSTGPGTVTCRIPAVDGSGG